MRLRWCSPCQQSRLKWWKARHRSLANEIGPVTANMARRVLRIVWNFAAERAPLPPNPVTRLKRQWFAEKRRKGRVQDHDLPAFFAAVQALPSRTAADYIALLLFTGMRKKETASLLWTDVDLVQKTITVRAEETKAGRELQLPMADFVFDMLVLRRALGSASPYVFPGSGETGHVVGALKALATVHKATGIKVSAHDLRRTFASVAAPEVNWLILKLMLNHAVSDDVTAGYVQVTMAQLRAAVGRLQIDKRAGKLAAEEGGDDELLNTTAVAEWLGVSTQWVEIGRSKNFGPAFQLLGSLIRYRRGAVKAWLREREYKCTAEYMKRRRHRERAEA